MCRYAECLYTECWDNLNVMQTVVMLNVVILSVVMVSVVTPSTFFAAYKLAKYGNVLQYTRLGRLARDKHFSLLGPFVSYEEIKFCKWGPRNFEIR